MSTKSIVWAVVVIIILIGAYVVFGTRAVGKTQLSQQASSAADLGTYPYECDEHVAFTMTPASDMSTIRIAPTSGTYPPASTLVNKNATSGVRFEGNGIVFTAHGETVTLGEGDSAITCSPLPNPDEPPFNFGD